MSFRLTRHVVAIRNRFRGRLQRVKNRILSQERLEPRQLLAVGVYEPISATWFLRNSADSGAVDFPAFPYGGSNWHAVPGDWDGNGVDTVGSFNPEVAGWYLRNSNASGNPDIASFAFGPAESMPVVGDWDGDGVDTIGVFDPINATWYLRNSNDAGVPDITPFTYGTAGFYPIVGDWDGDGVDTVGVYDPSSADWYLRNSNSSGLPDVEPFSYGGSGWQPVVHDWDGDGSDTIGVFTEAASWYLKNANVPGDPDLPGFAYGQPQWTALSGTWQSANPPMVASIPDQDATVGQQMVVSVSASDADGDPLSFSLDKIDEASPSDAIITQSSDTTATIRWTPSLSDVGTPVSFRVLVSDTGVSTQGVAEEFQVTVSADPTTTVLAEEANFSTQIVESVELGQDEGTRTIAFDIETAFDQTDSSPAVEDLFQVFLVDSNDPSITLLDNGEPGTAVFSLAGENAEYQPGLVRYDGSQVEIDVTSLGDLSAANLLFQIINSDADEGTKVALGPITNTTNTEALAAPRLAIASNPVAPSGGLNLAALSQTSQVEIEIQNVRFNAVSGAYVAEIVARNNGPAIGRELAVIFPGLPSDVTFENASGIDGNGDPYVNLAAAIGSGGLAAGASSRAVTIRLSNLNGSRFSLTPMVLSGGSNNAPTLGAIAPITAVPGDYIEILLDGQDADGDTLTYSLSSPNPLPNGMLMADGKLIFQPAPGQQGTYAFTVNLSDGVETVTRSSSITVETDPITSTRFSGRILDTGETALAGIPIEIRASDGTVLLDTITNANGDFFLESPTSIAADTVVIRGELFSGSETYPFIAEKLPLVLGHEIYDGAKNVIYRPIYLPALDVAGGTTIDPAQDTTVEQEIAPGEMASVFVEAGTLKMDDGTGGMVDFTGTLSITEVPTNLTPAALPVNLVPDTVVTIQPGEMVFTNPAELTLPNRAGYAPGTEMDLWSINPETGDFDKVGQGRVTTDGQSIETISGGINNSSWHLFAPLPLEVIEEPATEEDPNCGCSGGTGKETRPISSEVELHSGASRETHELVTYQSLGETHGFQLYYNSLHADPQPIVPFGYDNVPANDSRYLVAELDLMRGDFMYQLPGFVGGQGLDGGEHFWTLPSQGGSITAGLQVDLAALPTGVYDYNLRSGLFTQNGAGDFAGTFSDNVGQLYVTNLIDSPFGAGWSLAGQQSIIENPDGSVLLMDGGGTRFVFEPDTANPGQYLNPPADFSTLEKLGNGTFRRTMTDQTAYQFNEDNQLVTMTDRNGRVTEWQYDSAAQLVKWIDSTGLETTLSYTNGKVTTITDPANRVTELEYDDVGNLTRLTDPDGTSRSFGYDVGHRLTSEVDQRGFLEETFYGLDGRVERSVLKDGSERMVQSAQSAALSPFADTRNPGTAPVAPTVEQAIGTYSDANGSTQQVTLDRFGQRIAGTDFEGRLTQVSRSDNNLVERTTDARGNPIVFEYDEQGNVMSIADTISDAGGTFDRDLIEQGDDAAVELVNALVRPGSGIVPTEGSAIFVGQIGDGTDPNTAQSALYSGLILVGRDPSLPTISNPDGILLTSGSANVPRENTSVAWSVADPNTGSDADLEAILQAAGSSSTTNNVNSIEFEFTVAPGITSVEADFVFGSDEFPDQSVTDVFAFIIDGENYAVFPDGSLVSFVQGANADNFNDNDVGTDNYRIEFDGVSNSLHVVGLLDPTIPEGGTHTVKIAIANTSDQNFDSGVFIGNLVGGTATEAGSGIRTSTLRQEFDYDDTFNQLTSFTDELGHVTLYENDPANGNRLSMREVVGEVDDAVNLETDDLVTTYTYTSLGLVDTTTDPLGRVTDFDYNNLGRVTRVTFAVGTVDEAFQSFEYDAAGNQTAVIDENGNRTEYIYDSLNRLTQITEPDPDGAGPLKSPITSFTYDERGNLLTTTDARGNMTTNAYDSLSRLASTTDADGQVTSFGYDMAGNLARVTDPLGFTTRNIYDGRDRLVETVDPEGGITRFAYDTDDNLVSVIDPVGNETLFRYDARDRLVQETDPLGATTVYAYDPADNLIRKTDRNARVTEFAYDELNRLTTETWLADDGTAAENTIDYTYDKVSNLKTVVDAFSALEFTYDNRDRVDTVDNAGTPHAPNVILDYGYDGVGNVTSVADTIDGVAGATTSYAYDALNRTTTNQQSGNNVSDKLVDFVYNELGQFDEIARYSDLGRNNLVALSNYDYDELNRLTNLDHTNTADELLALYDFEYDPSSRITRLTDIDGVTDYSYDDRSQLTGADRDAADSRGDESYAYDANGNRTDSHLHGSSYVTGDGNRLLSEGTYNYEYDAEGNMTKRTAIATGQYREFEWDHRNRLIRVTDFSSGDIIMQEVKFAHDTLDRRISKMVDADGAGIGGEQATLFVHDREDVLLDLVDTDGPGATEVPLLHLRYLHGPGIDGVLAQENGAVQWLLNDHLGTVRDIISNAGVILNHVTFDSFGQIIEQIDPAFGTRYLFTGREFDLDLGLFYYRARYYDATAGRFLSEDGAGFGGGDANLYRYVGNAAPLLTDPSGNRSSLKDIPSTLNLLDKVVTYSSRKSIEINLIELGRILTDEQLEQFKQGQRDADVIEDSGERKESRREQGERFLQSLPRSYRDICDVPVRNIVQKRNLIDDNIGQTTFDFFTRD